MKDLKKGGVSLKGWISLIILIILLSGMFTNSDSFLAAFDYNNLLGEYGTIVDGINFAGKGGIGARGGFIAGLLLVPGIMFCTGLIAVVQHLGALDAAGILFKPILKPIMGLPGTTGLALIASFTGSDIAATQTKELYEDGHITDDERSIFVAYQYAASAPVSNTINAGAPLAAISPLSFGIIFIVELISKIFGANIIRLLISIDNKKKDIKENINNV